jgi:membrane associated rhomboid family serine protease
MESRVQPIETVYRSGLRKDCLRHALVLEAVGIDYETHEEAGGFTLVVAASDSARAREELDAYARENRDWLAGAATFPQRAGGWGGVLGYTAVLLLVAILQHQDTFAFDWVAAGRTHAGLIRHGQWWRTVTALSLHADLAHLVANIVIGGLVGLFAGQLFGSGLAWASILIAGAAGNLLNAWIRQPGHTSVGASTAVFAALGIVAAYVWKRRRHMQASKLARWAPLVGGVVLLSYLGTGGARTDVAAHVTGFLSGVLLGALYGKLGDRVMLAARAQFLLGMGALAVLALAWALALASHV